MSNKKFNELIKKKQGFFEQFYDLYWEGPDAILDAVKEKYINPDEAVIIGFMVGIKAYKIAEKKAKTEINSKPKKIRLKIGTSHNLGHKKSIRNIQ